MNIHTSVLILFPTLVSTIYCIIALGWYHEVMNIQFTVCDQTVFFFFFFHVSLIGPNICVIWEILFDSIFHCVGINMFHIHAIL